MRGVPAGALLVACLLAVVRPTHAHDAPSLHPPELLSRVEPAYPSAALRNGESGQVVMLVEVRADGTVGEVEVVQSAGEHLDAAAVLAVQQWRFTPASVDGHAIPIRMRVAQRFELPTLDGPLVPAVVAPHQGSGATPPMHAHPGEPPHRHDVPDSPEHHHPDGTPPHDDQHTHTHTHAAPEPASTLTELVLPATLPTPTVFGTRVSGRRVGPPRSGSDFTLDADVMNVTLTQDGSELLRAVPGIYVARPDGFAVAQEIFLRGFDASHGQDLELSLDGVPINQPSHVHGQGYADLAFLIPEAVLSVRVQEGVVDPRQGDFATAGSAAFELGRKKRGIHMKLTAGSFGTFRLAMVGAPEGLSEGTLVAAQVRGTQGFGDNRGGLSGSALGQLDVDLPSGWMGRMMLGAHGARSNLAGVLRRDDVDAGRVDFLGSYSDPSASAQSALAGRALGSLKLVRPSDGGSFTMAQGWVQLAQSRLRQNNTGYTERSIERPDWVGRGDLNEQANLDLGTGGRMAHRLPWFRPLPFLQLAAEAGMQFRTDVIQQSVNLLQAPQNETWDRRLDAQVLGADVGAYVDVELRFTPHLRVMGGGRADVLLYDVDDRLGNSTPAFRQADNIRGYRRTALGLAMGPRMTLEMAPVLFLPAYVAYGEGYRSPQANQLEEGENAPYTKVRNLEAGLRIKDPALAGRFTLTATAWLTTLSQDLAYDPTEGVVQKLGPSSRRGVALVLDARPTPWLLAYLSATYVNATLDAPPPGNAENPTPAYARGQLLPYVPPLVLQARLGVNRVVTRAFGSPVAVRAGLNGQALSARPLPYRQWSAPVMLWDLSAGVALGPVDIGVDVQNLLDARYAQSEYVYSSDWRTTEVPSRIPARHTAAGAPRMVLFSLGVQL